METKARQQNMNSLIESHLESTKPIIIYVALTATHVLQKLY